MYNWWKPFYRTVTAISLVGLIILGFGTQAHAVPLTFAYEGTVSHVPERPPFTMFQGETLRVEFTFESSSSVTEIIDFFPSARPPFFLYGNAISSLVVTIGGNQYFADTGDIFIGDNIRVTSTISSNGDNYIFRSAPLTGPEVGDTLVDRFSLNLIGSTNTFSGNALPTKQPDPNDFNLPKEGDPNDFSLPKIDNQISLRFCCDPSTGYSESVLANKIQITSVSTIPEPSTMLLFGSGLFSLLAWRMKRGKKHSGSYPTRNFS